MIGKAELQYVIFICNPMHNPAVTSLEITGRARLCAIVFLALAWITSLGGCGASAGKQEYSYVAAPEAVLRDRIAAVYTKTGTLHNGERVVVLEHLPNRRFVRVRSSRGEEGWIQERYLTDQQTFDEFQHLLTQFKDAPTQAVAETRAQVNLHVSPGRKTEHLYQLSENQKVDLLQRKTADKNAAAPPANSSSKPDGKESEAEPATGEESSSQKPTTAPVLEDWWLVRDAQKRVGWVLGRMLYIDVPLEVAVYAEGHRIVAFYVLDQIHDEDEQKNVPEYLMLLSEAKDGLPYDYDQVRVFTWNIRRHRYETAYRLPGLNGFLPVTLGRENFAREGDLRTFTLQVADPTGSLHEQKYKFNPPIVRQVLAPGEQPVPKVHRKAAKASRTRSR
jgi:SH3-like domain-containing protein